VPTRFSSEINRLRAALRGKHRSSDAAAILHRQIDTMTAAALVADNSMRYVASNPAARELTGFTESELLRMTVADLTPLSHTVDGRELWADFIARGTQRGEYELRRRDGTAVRVRYWAFASVAPGLHVSLLVPAGAAG
jgi:PAS domain S-box-containing protein